MSIYNNKHCVFEMVGVDYGGLMWNSDTNLDNDNCYNNWNISNMRNTHLPAKLLVLSSVLQDNLTVTTIQTATNGNNGTLISTSDKLFLAAQKEMTTNPNLARTEENNALITWTYWVNHTQQSDRVKYDPSNVARQCWLRSPYSGNGTSVVYVRNNGSFTSDGAYFQRRFSPCFAF